MKRDWVKYYLGFLDPITARNLASWLSVNVPALRALKHKAVVNSVMAFLTRPERGMYLRVKKLPVSLSQRILAYIAHHGPCTAKKLSAVFGRYITASQAMRSHEAERRRYIKKHGRVPVIKRTGMDPVVFGRNREISHCVQSMRRCGHLVRVAPATYAIPKQPRTPKTKENP